MAQISRDQRKTLDKFIDIAYRRGYLIDWDMWDLQIDFAPETGFWSAPIKDVRDTFPKFEEYRDGVAMGIRLGLETVIQLNMGDDVNTIRQYVTPLLEGFYTESLKWPASHGMESMRVHTDVAQILEGLPPSAQSSGIFDDYLEASRKELHEYARKVSNLLAEHIRNAAGDDRHVADGLTELASYAYAYWKAENWRFHHGEHGDEISEDALNVFLDTLDELDKLSSNEHTGPDTVDAAFLAFMKAYSAGELPLRPRKDMPSAGTR